MKVLLLGSGGREHALAWKIAQSPKIEKLYIAPGNAGTNAVGENVEIKATDFPDRAGAIDGRFVVTDEVENGNGKPKINGVKYDVWGIGEDESGTYVIESARGNRFYIRGGEKKFVSHPNKGRKKKAMEIIHEIYAMLR